MRAKEFIFEREFSQRKSSVLSTAFEFPSMPSADPYQSYRFSMAMADHTMAHAEGPISNHALIVAYTPEEEAIIKGASKQTGNHGRLVADRGSNEPKHTQNVSPVAKPKRNRYGV
jgi:hypothetical protein